MDKDFCIERIHKMLEEADERMIRLVYRFLCGLLYR